MKKTNEHVQGVSHTPGPWKADKGVEDDPNRCFVTQAIPGRPAFVIAEVQNGAPGDCLETEEANARLIAAAPDMLAALKHAERFCLCGARPESPTTHPHVPSCPIGLAIKKAEGRHGH